MRYVRLIMVCLGLVGCTSMQGTTPTLPVPLLSATSTPLAQSVPDVTSTMPRATPEPTIAAPTAVPAFDDPAQLAALHTTDLPRDQYVLAQAWNTITAPLAPREPLNPPIGDQYPFWAINIETSTPFQITATLQVRTPHLAFYIANSQTVDPAQLQATATTWERDIWPILAAWYPSVDLAEPVTILYGSIPGVGGYYAADNELPATINRFSNQRLMVFINSDSVAITSSGFLSVLTHEMQHLLHKQVLYDSATWFNEGASMLSEYVTDLGDNNLARIFLSEPDTQLNSWAATPNAALRHYGGAELWMRYFNDQLSRLPLGELAARDAGDDLQVWVELLQQSKPDLQTLDDVFATWATANLVNDSRISDGRYGYASLPATVEPVNSQLVTTTTVHQLAADYLEWTAAPLERVITWTGSLSVPVISAPTQPADTMWWSGRGDNRVSTLTTAVSVPDQGAMLSYRSWFDIEADYDYAYLSLSTDNGATWRSIPTRASTAANPLGINLGAGWTGAGQTWNNEQIDLQPWAGQTILLRFWMINDDAYNAQGVALDDLRLEPEQPLEWQAQGWQEIVNQLPQAWELRLVLDTLDGPQITEISVEQGSASWTIPADTRAVLVVAATTSVSTIPATYSLTTTP